MEKDLVCGMNVNPKSALKTEFEGKTYYFCSDSCKKQFESDPRKYIGTSMGHGHGGCC